MTLTNYDPLSNPTFVNTFQQMYGRKPTRDDLKRYSDAKRGIEPEPTIMDRVGQFAGPVGILGGMYLAQKIPELSIGSIFGGGAGDLAVSAGSDAVAQASSSAVGDALWSQATDKLASQAGTMGTTKAPASTLGGGFSLASIVPAFGAAAGTALLAKGAKDLFSDDSGDPFSRAQLGITTGGLSELYRYGQDKLWGAGKDERQQMRDEQRQAMIDAGILGSDYTMNGVDIGRDGGFTFDDGRKVYEVYAGQEDGSGEISDYHRDLIGNTQAAGFLLGDRPDASYATGMIANAIQGNETDDIQELRALYDQMGGKDAVFSAIGDAANSGRLDLETAQAYQNSLNNIYSDDYRMANVAKALMGV